MDSRPLSLSRYVPPSSDPSTHFRIVVGKTFGGFETLPCLLARAWADGRFELLTPAWDALGYSGTGLTGRYVCELVALEQDAACAALKVLLTEGGALEFGLRRKDGGESRYRWNRQFDDFTGSMFILGDEQPAAPSAAKSLRWPILETA